MRTLVTLRLLSEARAYTLAWTCDDCAYFREDTERCSHSYPETVRRGASPLRLGDTVAFCKEFEAS